jgi:hypothetical protein
VHGQQQQAGGQQPGQPPPAPTAESSVKGRKLLVRILDTFVRKFGTLKEYTKKLSSIKDDDKLDSPAVQLEFMPFRYVVCEHACICVCTPRFDKKNLPGVDNGIRDV